MYWEEVWRYTQVAANFSADEKNSILKFQFLLQADSKAAKKWKDSPLPFPSEEYLAKQRRRRDVGGISQLPNHLKKRVQRVYKKKPEKQDG